MAFKIFYNKNNTFLNGLISKVEKFKAIQLIEKEMNGDFLVEINEPSNDFTQGIEFFVRKSSKIGVLMNFMKEKEETIKTKKVVLALEEDLEDDYNTQQIDFLEEIVVMNFQIIKFLDFDDVAQYFNFLAAFVEQKKKEIFKSHASIYAKN